jgi:hypothetical protein
MKKIYALFLAMGLLATNRAVVAEAGASPPTPEACKEVQTCGSSDCCAYCGCHGCCEKYCRIVCEMKEVKKTVWAVHCKDFCAPLPNCPLHCCEGCENGDDESCKTCNCENSCDKHCDVCADLENRNYVPPHCGKVRTVKTLEKKEVTCKIPAYKCVVVYVCQNCGSKCSEGIKADQSAPMPAAPDSNLLPAPKPPIPTKTTMSAPSSIIKASYMK